MGSVGLPSALITGRLPKAMKTFQNMTFWSDPYTVTQRCFYTMLNHRRSEAVRPLSGAQSYFDVFSRRSRKRTPSAVINRARLPWPHGKREAVPGSQHRVPGTLTVLNQSVTRTLPGNAY